MLTEPVILRGGARSFLSSSSSSLSEQKRINRWSLDALARENPTRRVLVRASSTPSFPVPNGALLPFVVDAFGTRAAPSLASFLPLREAAERMQAGCSLPPLAFSSSSSSSPDADSGSDSAVVSDGNEGGRCEWYYIQSQVPREWIEGGAREAAEVESSPLSALVLSSGDGRETNRGGGGSGGGGGETSPSPRISQDFRLWLSPPNAVSPLHWDVSRSALAVLLGTKKFHFWDPETTFSRLRPRSEWSLLRRRCAADPTRKDQDCPPATLRAVVRSGDAVAFPPYWAHHVLSHNEEGEEGGGEEEDEPGGGEEEDEPGGVERARTGRPILALTRRASSSAVLKPPLPRRIAAPSRLWKGGLGTVRSVL